MDGAKVSPRGKVLFRLASSNALAFESVHRPHNGLLLRTISVALFRALIGLSTARWRMEDGQHRPRPPCDEAAILAGSCAPRITTTGPWILAATILGSSMAFIDGTVVNVALPALQSALGATLADVQWVVEAYALFLAAFLLVGGSLGDRYGRRRIFATGVAIFSAASVWCGLAPDIRQLIVARGLQGVGGALLVPGSLALISANFPEKERGRAIGTWSGFTSITAAIGPVLGGWFIEHGSWRWVFFINIPLGLAVLSIALWKVPESTADNPATQFDWPGGLQWPRLASAESSSA